ncbi:MAG: hypothetical protein U0T56_10190 [Ferruginibacter sp.]
MQSLSGFGQHNPVHLSEPEQWTIHHCFPQPGGVRYDNLPPQALIAQRVLTVFDAKGARV